MSDADDDEGPAFYADSFLPDLEEASSLEHLSFPRSELKEKFLLLENDAGEGNPSGISIVSYGRNGCECGGGERGRGCCVESIDPGELETIEVENYGGSGAEHARMVEEGELSIIEKISTEFTRALTKRFTSLG